MNEMMAMAPVTDPTSTQLLCESSQINARAGVHSVLFFSAEHDAVAS